MQQSFWNKYGVKAVELALIVAVAIFFLLALYYALNHISVYQ